MNFDPVDFGKRMGGMVKDMLSPLMKRIEALESRQLEKGEKGDPGPRGKDAEPVSAESIIDGVIARVDFKALFGVSADAALAEYLKENPIKHGVDGKDAEPVSVDQVVAGLAATIDIKSILLPELPAIVAKHFEYNPVKHGIDGKDGADADPIDIAEVANEILESDAFKMITGLQLSKAVDVHFQNHPVQHGKDGKDAQPVADEQIAKHVSSYLAANPAPQGQKGEDGKDGIGLAGAMIDREGELIITTTKGEAVRLGKVVGKDGENGADGFKFEDFEATYDGDRGLQMKFHAGGRVKEFEFNIPIMIHRGFWQDGKKFKQGDSITYDGNLWYALRDTKKKPCSENKDDWQLAARRGRDGDSYREKKEPEPVRLKADA